MLQNQMWQQQRVKGEDTLEGERRTNQETQSGLRRNGVCVAQMLQHIF